MLAEEGLLQAPRRFDDLECEEPNLKDRSASSAKSSETTMSSQNTWGQDRSNARRLITSRGPAG